MIETVKLAMSEGYEVNPYIGDSGYFCLCDIQRWLRDNHKLHVRVDNVNHPILDKWYYEIQILPSGIINLWEEDSEVYNTYELALETGLLEALKIIP